MMLGSDQLSPFATPEYVTLRRAVLWIGLKLVPAPPHVEAYRNDPKTVESQGLLSRHDYSKIERAKSLLYDRLVTGVIRSIGIRKDVYLHFINKVSDVSQCEEPIAQTEWAYYFIRWDESALLFSEYDDVPYPENAYLYVKIKTDEMFSVFPSDQAVSTVDCGDVSTSGTRISRDNDDSINTIAALQSVNLVTTSEEVKAVPKKRGPKPKYPWDQFDEKLLHELEYRDIPRCDDPGWESRAAIVRYMIHWLHKCGWPDEPSRGELFDRVSMVIDQYIATKQSGNSGN